MAERRYGVDLTASFLERLASIEAFLTEADAGPAYDRLLEELRHTVLPNLERFPRLGRRYLDRLPRSVEALGRLAAWPAGAAESLREYLHGDYLILYSVLDERRTVHLLTIRHHRELSFDFSGLWTDRSD